MYDGMEIDQAEQEVWTLVIIHHDHYVHIRVECASSLSRMEETWCGKAASASPRRWGKLEKTQTKTAIIYYENHVGSNNDACLAS